MKDPAACRRGRLNKAKGKTFERTVTNMFKGAFPGYNFKRVPDSRMFVQLDGLKFEGDIMVPEGFPYRNIECRSRQKGAAYDLKRFFNKFKTSEFGKWLDECNEKFKEPWIVIFKVSTEPIFVMIKDDLGIEKHIYNGKVYVYTLYDYIDWLVLKMKEIKDGKSRSASRRNKKN